MLEVTNERAQNPQARRDAHHGITINEITTPAGPFSQASCLCGWQSDVATSRALAVVRGQVHESQVARARAAEVRSSVATTLHSAEGVQDSHTPDVSAEPRYLDRVADAVAQRIRERGVVLTVDELATVAMALDCSTTDLLPLHLQDPEKLTTADALIWDDPYGTVRVVRLPWLSDSQWAHVRDGMIAHFEAAGLIRDDVAS